MSSFGDFISLSDVCDKATALLIKREVSDGVIAPGYDDDALEILKAKKNGNYNVIEIDPDYIPDPIERKQVFGVTFEQGRNELNIDEHFFDNIVTENKELPESAKRDLAISMITLKYTQSNSCLLYTSRTECKSICIWLGYRNKKRSWNSWISGRQRLLCGSPVYELSLIHIQMCIRDRHWFGGAWESSN